MKALQQLNHEFNNSNLTTIVFQGRPLWLPSEISTALGYSVSKKLVDLIRNKWAEDFSEGVDYLKFEGRQLSDLKRVLELDTHGVSSHTKSLILLTETGLTMALLKTQKPAGVVLRRFIADEVMPQISRTGRYDPTHKELTAMEREQRLLAREQRLDRESRAKALTDLVANLGDILDPAAVAALQFDAAQLASGQPLGAYKPDCAQLEKTMSATEIAEEIGVSANAVGRAARTLGMKDGKSGVDGLSRVVATKAAHCDKTVTQFLYTPKAVAELKSYFIQRSSLAGEES